MKTRFPQFRDIAHRSMLTTASSLVGTTAVTSTLGFAYWWVAARLFPTEAVGLAAALISAMGLLGTIGMLGLGTLLIAELPLHADKRESLIGTAFVVAAIAGTALGLVFALVAPHFVVDFSALADSLTVVVLFAAGVGLTAASLVLDQAVVGLLRGSVQLRRNAV